MNRGIVPIACVVLAFATQSCAREDLFAPLETPLSPPVFSIVPGTYGQQTLTFELRRAGTAETLYYTVDGTAPTTASAKADSSVTFTLNGTAPTLRVRAFSATPSPSWNVSAEVDGTFRLEGDLAVTLSVSIPQTDAASVSGGGGAIPFKTGAVNLTASPSSLAFSWYLNGTQVPGANSAIISLGSSSWSGCPFSTISPPALDPGTYRVSVRGYDSATGNVYSSQASFTVNP